METIGDRLKRLREAKRWSQAKLARESGLKSQGTIGNIEAGTRGYGDSVVAIARTLGTSPEYLMLETDDPKSASSWDQNAAPAPTPRYQREYPVISSVQAGEWADIMDDFQPGDADEMVESPIDLGPNGFVLRVDGMSMTNPEGGKDNFPDGMLIYIKPEVDVYPGDYVVAKRVDENKATFKQLVNVEGELHLFAINPAWPKPYIKLEPLDRIIGKMKFAGWGF